MISKNFGRIHYIEPTNFNNETMIGRGENITSPYEDYCMSIDLSIENVNRYSCGQDIKTEDLKFSTVDNTLSFLGGSKITNTLSNGYLTTNFTDISMTNPSTNTSECLGIEFISITYDPKIFTPQVVIRFIDIRGASLMQPSEYGYYNDLDLGNSRNIYKAFFTFPYPTFVLKVKGYYGMGITLRLCMYKTDLEFDSESGNFNITASFTGHLYGILTDIPMTYIAIAPYTTEGREYWAQKVQEGVFKFRDISGNPNKPMEKIPELRYKIALAAKNEKAISAASKGQTVMSSFDEQISSLRSIIDSFPFNNWKEYTYKNNNFWLKVVRGSDEIYNIEEELKNYYNLIKNYDVSNTQNFSKYFKSLKPISEENEKITKGVFQIGYDSYSHNYKVIQIDKGDGNHVVVAILNNLENDSFIINNPIVKQPGTYFLCIIPQGEFPGIDTFKDSINRDINSLQLKKRNEEKTYKEQEASIIEEIIGFRPSIRNIYNLIFAHMDTFLHCFYGHTKQILDQFKNNDLLRKKSYYNLRDEETDTERSKVDIGNNIPYSQFLPPYTAFYKQKMSSTVKEMVWPEILKPSLSSLEEVGFINDFLSATEMYDKRDEYLTNILNNFSGDTSEATGSNLPNLDISGFIPITKYDYVHKDKFENPYLNVLNSISQNNEDIEGLIMGIFALRAFYHLSDFNNKSDAKVFGRIEAINFFKAIGDTTSTKLLKFINDVNKRDNFLEKITTTKFNSVNKVWVSENKSLFKHNGSYLEYTFDDEKMLPLAFYNPLKIKDRLINSKEIYDDYNFISVKKPIIKDLETYKEFFDKDIENKKFSTSFYLFKERNYIQTINNMVENELKRSSEIIIDKINEQERYFDEFGKTNWLGNTLRNYKDNFNAYLNKKTYDTYAIVNSEGKKDNSFFDILKSGEYSDFNNYYITIGISKLGEDEHFINGNIYLKAFLFLNSINISNYNNKFNDGLVLKSLLLKEGANYWYFEQNKDNIKNLDSLELDVTPSRIKVLKEYFEEWVNTDFALNLEHLLNRKLYKNENYKDGLKIQDLVASKDIKFGDDIENGRKLQEFLRDLFFSVHTVIDFYNYKSELTCDSEYMKTAFNAFVTQLKDIYKNVIDGIKENKSVESYIGRQITASKLKNHFRNDDIRLSTYMTMKSLYDKWLCKSLYNPEKNRNGNNFIYIDSFHHEIGDLLTVNVSKISNWLSTCLPTSNTETNAGTISTITNKSVYQFLTQVAEDNGGLLMCLPCKFGQYNGESVKEMFTPKPLYSNWDNEGPSYIFMYSYKPSEHLGEKNSGLDMNGWSEEGDGFNITDEGLLTDEGFSIPAFGVTYAKQNQSIFKNIRLNTGDAGITEIGINSTFNIIAQNSEGPRETTFFGQDIYKIISQYAYQCSVETMGNAQIMPMMYFQLNNVPFWKGAYQILKVNHEITAGNFTTTFQGVRINKNAIPFNDSLSFQIPIIGTEGDNTSPNITKNTIIDMNSNTIDIKGNPNLSPLTNEIDFEGSNVTKTKPLICLTPAHGPRTNKKREWEWSSKVVDRIKEILSEYKYSDGTPYNIQRCNKGGQFTDDGYKMTETKNFINILGSENVISVVPHWNGGGGQRYEIYLNRSGLIREDSKELAECMKAEVNNIITKIKNGDITSNVLPNNAIEDTINILPLPSSNSDEGPRINCACLLTENWYADYKEGGGGPSAWERGKLDGLMYNWLNAYGENGGIETIAQMHAKAIKRYIDSLS